MIATSSPGIGDALQILFHLLYFVFVLSAVSLFLEKIWTGPSRWVIVPIVIFSLGLLCFRPGLILTILNAVVGPTSAGNFGAITLSGMLAGMVGTSL